MSTELLTKEEYIKILQAKFLNQDVKFQSAECNPLSQHREGFVGDHYILDITYVLNGKESTESFFLKTKPVQTEIQRALIKNMNVYEKEIFLYNTLFKEFEKLGYDTSFAPKAYYCKESDSIVMDNLKEKGFILFPRAKFFDLDHCKLVLKSLAQYHANSFAYEETKSKELEKPYRLNQEKPELFNEIFYHSDKDSFGYKFYKSSYDGLQRLADAMDESQEWKDSFKKRLTELDLPKIFNQRLPYRTTCCHGDLWSNNMLFKYSNGSPIHCCLVDFQMLRYHHPAFDPILVIYSNTTKEFRKEHLKSLLDHYYANFEEILRKNGYEARSILPKDHFLKTADIFKPIATMQGVSIRLMTTLPPSVLHSFIETGGKDYGEEEFREKKTQLLVEAFKNDENYRKIITEEIYDVNEVI